MPSKKAVSSKSTPPTLARRLKALRARMAEDRLDGYLLTHPADIAQYTGFSGHDSTALVTGRSVTVITDTRYTEEVSLTAPHVRVALRKNAMAEAVALEIIRQKVARIAFERNFTTFGLVDALKRETTRRLGGRLSFLPMSDLLVSLRKNKDAQEIATIRTAIEIAESAFLEVVPRMKAGMTESMLTGLLMLAMRARGASDAAFAPIVATGPHSSLPHYRPDATPIATKGPLLIDWGAVYNGYRSDLTRTVFLGKPHKQLAEIYKVVLDANLATIDKLRAGLNCKEADAIARQIITRAGYGKCFGHGTGHGIGRDIHEEPRLHTSREKDYLEAGSVVTVEPGIYLPGVGGVRIEDDVLITDNGCQVLTSLDKSLEWAMQVMPG